MSVSLRDEALSRWIRMYGNQLLRIAYAHLGVMQSAEDCTQEALTKAYQAYNRLKNPEREFYWLIRIVINECHSYRRRALPLARQEDSNELQTELSAEENYLRIWESEKIMEEIRNLPWKYRVPVILFYLRDLSTHEISEILHLGESTIRTRLHRGRTLLKKRLKEDDFNAIGRQVTDGKSTIG